MLLTSCGSREQTGNPSESRSQCQIVVAFANWYADQLEGSSVVFAIGDQDYRGDIKDLDFRKLGQDDWVSAPAPPQHLLARLTTRKTGTDLQECPELLRLGDRPNIKIGSDAAETARKTVEPGNGFQPYSKVIVTMALPAFDTRTGEAVLPVREDRAHLLSSLGVVYLKLDKDEGWRPLSVSNVWDTSGVP